MSTENRKLQAEILKSKQNTDRSNPYKSNSMIYMATAALTFAAILSLGKSALTHAEE
jgi:hypothetical protein